MLYNFKEGHDTYSTGHSASCTLHASLFKLWNKHLVKSAE